MLAGCAGQVYSELHDELYALDLVTQRWRPLSLRAPKSATKVPLSFGVPATPFCLGRTCAPDSNNVCCPAPLLSCRRVQSHAGVHRGTYTLGHINYITRPKPFKSCELTLWCRAAGERQQDWGHCDTT